MKAEPAGKNVQQKRRSKPLLDAEDPLRSVKRLLDQVLLEGQQLPAEVRQAIAVARDMSWQRFIEEEQALSAKAG